MLSLSTHVSKNIFKSITQCSKLRCRSIMMSAVNRKIFTVQDEDDFKQSVLGSELPVIVDFHASWCGPCKILEPRLETIVGKHHEKVHLAKVDIDDHAELALEYGVQAVPHVTAFKNGQQVSHFTGVRDEDEIESFVSNVAES